VTLRPRFCIDLQDFAAEPQDGETLQKVDGLVFMDNGCGSVMRKSRNHCACLATIKNKGASFLMQTLSEATQLCSTPPPPLNGNTALQYACSAEASIVWKGRGVFLKRHAC
jgi:hypothetical protein